MPKRDTLQRYRQKRDFIKTREPKGTVAAKSGYRYLIQKHAATRLHYDFRLELDGVLKSWAVTRGPSLDPHEKRLAVEVEDHPVSYGSFEGIIPKGQYGGGTVMLWDEGEWEPIGDPHQGLANGKLEFTLRGKRLQGEWTLVRMRDREKDKGRHNWLLIKRSDQRALAGDNDKLLAKNDTSVTTGRKMEQIAGAEDRIWHSNQTTEKRQTTLPTFFPPQLATLTDAVPRGKEWVHEIKFDGYRGLAFISDKTVRILTRTGQDWTHKFRTLAQVLSKLPIKNAILDGEIVALKEQRVSSFKALQNALSHGSDSELQFYVFDLPFLNGDDLRPLPLLERKVKLEALLKAKALSRHVFYSEHFTAHGEELLKRICGNLGEGVVSKLANAPYTSGRGTSWLKTKCHLREEFVIGGFTLPTHAERGVGALLIGYYEKEKLIYAGKVGTGFNSGTSLSLRKKLESIRDEAAGFAVVPVQGKRGANWVKPQLVCEVEFTEWTTDGRLRHPSFQGLREDKPAESIQRDFPMKPQAKKKSGSSNSTVEGISITHPDRIVYPGTQIAKIRLVEYYHSVAEHILPHLKNRPLSMVRCPDGVGGKCFFQRHIAQGQSPHLYDTGIEVKGRGESYLTIKDVKGLVALVQWGAIELHPWGCLADKPDLPDRIVFDLDPDPTLSWKAAIEAAQDIRQRMEEFGLVSFVKTTGGKGLHVVIPIARTYGWKPIKAFARAIAESMQRDNPKLYIAKAGKEARAGKIFVDYLRNDLTSTSVAPFSARAREGATVAMPIAWEELKPALQPQTFSIETVPDMLRKRGEDPWQELLKVRQKIARRHLQALNIEA